MAIPITIIFLIIILWIIVNFYRSKYELPSTNYIWLLFFVHQLLAIAYLVNALFSPSDSKRYFQVASSSENWSSLFDTGTNFITFLEWPLVNIIRLDYISSMFIFSFLGFIGILLFYLSAKENENLQKGQNFKFGILEILFLLPNLHFWTSSIGKGSVIILGLGLLVYGLNRFNVRFFQILLGLALVYFVRPHIILSFFFAIIFAITFLKSGLSNGLKLFIVVCSLLLFYLLNDNVLEYAELENLNVFDSEVLTKRSTSLTSATSGFDINSYSLPMKLFTFWFRPLFIDSPNILGIFVSFENLFYFYLFFALLFYGPKNFGQLNGWYRILIIMFFLTSIILSQVTGNMGIAIRQKSQIMPLFFIVVAKILTLRDEFKSK